jgi:hypothetical protein
MKHYNIQFAVDIDRLKEVYMESQDLTEEELEVNNITVPMMLEVELGWVKISGVYLIGEIEEIKYEQ